MMLRQKATSAIGMVPAARSGPDVPNPKTPMANRMRLLRRGRAVWLRDEGELCVVTGKPYLVDSPR